MEVQEVDELQSVQMEQVDGGQPETAAAVEDNKQDLQPLPTPAGNGNLPMSQPPPEVTPVVLWVETKTDAGKSYYYHNVTRETTWTVPEGPGVKIVTQSELEAINAKKQQHLVMPSAAAVVDSRLGDPVMHQKPPVLLNHPFGAPPPRFPNVLRMPPPAFAPPPTWILPPAQVAPAGNPLIDPSIVAKANEWTEHQAPDGRTFYYNAAKSESVWEKPEAIRELEAARLAAQVMTQAPPLMPHPHHHPPLLPPPQLGAMPVMPPGAGWIHQVLAAQQEAQMNKRAADERKEQEDRARAAQQEQVQRLQQQLSAKPVDKSKPVSSTPISGTPWCVVWTGDGRVFFYNPSTKTSVWERPEELNERADVTKAMSTVPEQLLATNPGNILQTTRATTSSAAPVAVAVATVGAIAPTVLPTSVTGDKDHAEQREKIRSEAESDEENDENNSFPNKKQKSEASLDNNAAPNTAVACFDNNATSTTTNTAGVSAAEAELQASRERSIVPLEQRVALFREMLREKDVSAFSTWEKELHKIVFDQRYLLLTSRERKQIFEKYVKDRAEEERKEKRTKMRQKASDFRELMESAGLHGKSTFSEFAQRFAKDERLRAIEKMRERESLFNEFIIEVRKREKEEATGRREQAGRDFIQMLRDHPHVDRHSRWTEVKKWVEGKAAYRAVDGGGEAREELFNEYLKLVREERKKRKEKEKERGKEKEKDKSRDKSKHEKTKERGKERKSSREEGEAEEENEENEENKETLSEEKKKRRSSELTSEEDVEDEIANEEEAVRREEQQQRQRERERQMRAEASIKEREKQVQRTLAGHLRERDNKREHHKKGEAVAHFSALLTDLVRNADLTWKEVKRQLRKDSRFPVIEESLEREERERLFNEHVHGLAKKKRDKFRQMLDEIGSLELTSPWKEVKRQVKEDPRYLKYNSSEQCEREFREYIRDKTLESKAAFRELLLECKMITHKTLETLNESPAHMHEIEEILKNDKRFLVLNHVAAERNSIIHSHLEELHKRGPPPPPTAATANRRKQ